MRISARSLDQSYGDKKILHDLNFEIESGEAISLLGTNGSGKSTLIRTLCGIMPTSNECVYIDGSPISDFSLQDRSKIISYVPQFCPIAPHTTVLESVLIGRRPYVEWSYSDDDIDAAIGALETMDIKDLANSYISELSGGQMQRVNLARSLAQNPRFFLFDEPTSALDLRYQMTMMKTMQNLIKEQEVCMLMAIHDINIALRFTNRAIMLKEGSLFFDGPVKEAITEDNIRKVYGVESRVIDTEHGMFVLPYNSVES